MIGMPPAYPVAASGPVSRHVNTTGIKGRNNWAGGWALKSLAVFSAMNRVMRYLPKSDARNDHFSLTISVSFFDAIGWLAFNGRVTLAAFGGMLLKAGTTTALHQVALGAAVCAMTTVWRPIHFAPDFSFALPGGLPRSMK